MYIYISPDEQLNCRDGERKGRAVLVGGMYLTSLCFASLNTCPVLEKNGWIDGAVENGVASPYSNYLLPEQDIGTAQMEIHHVCSRYPCSVSL
jgi:hypothetical protein